MPQHLLDSRMLGPLGVLTTGPSRGGRGRDLCATAAGPEAELSVTGYAGGDSPGGAEA